MLRELPRDWEEPSEDDDLSEEDMEMFEGMGDEGPMSIEEMVNLERLERILIRRLQNQMPTNENEIAALLDEQFSENDDPEVILAKARENNWDDAEEAQELMFQAMCLDPEEDASEITALAERALALDPDNGDAGLILATTDVENVQMLIPRLRDVVSRAENALDQQAVQDFTGHLWSYPLARPYLRCRLALMGALREAEEWNEAATECESIHQLAGDDDLDLEGTLLTLYLASGNVRKTRTLLKQRKHIDGCTRDWAVVIEQFLSNNKGAARKSLGKALNANPYVPVYLLSEDMPQSLPEASAPGTREEAILCVYTLTDAWVAHPEVIDWLIAEIAPQK